MTNLELEYRRRLKQYIGIKRMYRGGYKVYENTMIGGFIRLSVALKIFGKTAVESINIKLKK